MIFIYWICNGEIIYRHLIKTKTLILISETMTYDILQDTI